MTSWSHGYNVSTGYTYGFYRETAPDWLDLALAVRGLEPPRSDGGQPFRYLELGSGQGFGLCLLAAAYPAGEFLGIDFSPEHIAHSRSLADELGLTNISFVEGDFRALGTAWPADYGEFDYVVLHGIYSWVPQDIRRSLIAVLADSVRSGGAVYVSFNAMPGWVSTLPFQHLLRSLQTSKALQGMSAIEAGRELFAKLENAGSGITKALPGLKSRIEHTRKQPAAYLVQEYLHENWHPLWCSQVMTELAEAKLDLAASATLPENLLPKVLPRELEEIVAEHSEPRLREDLTDCLINQTFRRDIYLRGARRRHYGQTRWMEGFRFWRLKQATPSAELSISTAFGGINLQAKSFAPLLEALSERSMSLAELAGLPEFAKDLPALQQNLLLLVHSGWLGCGRPGGPDESLAPSCNAALAHLGAVGAPYRHLAAPRIGSAVPASDTELLMLEAHLADAPAFEQNGAEILRRRMERLGRKLARDGKPLPAEEESAQLQRVADTFLSHTLPSWRLLGVIA